MIILLLLICNFVLIANSKKSDNEDELVGHVRQSGEAGLNADALAALTTLFRDEWRNESLLPEYSNDLTQIKCPKWRGRPHTVWCDANGDVTRLSLLNAGLHGALFPASLLRLSKLAVLELVNPSGVDDGPLDGLAQFSNLQSLTIAHSSAVVGSLPGAALASMTGLYELHIAECPNLSGAIPSELGLLSKLEKLSLFRNQLHSSLPTQLGLLTKLLHLYTFQNRLSGTVPTQFGALTELIECRLQRSMRAPHADANTFACPLPSNLPAACKKQAGFLTLCHEQPRTEL
jgi:Leucine-rich repeat (LRR) protein